MAERNGNPSKPDRDYLVEQTPGSIIRNTFHIFFGNYWALFLIYCVPVVPFAVIQLHGEHSESAALAIVGTIGLYLAMLFTWTAVTVAVGDVCAGNKMRVIRAYRRGFVRNAPRVLGTSLIFTVALILVFVGLSAIADSVDQGTTSTLGGLGLMLAIFIAIVMLGSFYFITFQVTALEPRWGFAAMRRSRHLGKGYYSRNFFVMVLCLLVALIPHLLLVGAVYAMALAWLGDNGFTDVILMTVVYSLAPLYTVAQVLLYYDMRVRKELYNLTVLVSELR